MHAMFHGIPDGVDQKKLYYRKSQKKDTVGFFFVQWPEVQLAFFCWSTPRMSVIQLGKLQSAIFSSHCSMVIDDFVKWCAFC
jgi:hypothetical protein